MSLHTAPGDRVDAADLQSPAARAALAALARGVPYVSLVEVRRVADRDVLVLDIEPEVPQDPVYDVRAVERVAVLFRSGPAGPPPVPPSVRALRTDFPDVPHLNLTEAGEPRSLCLYEAPYSERRLTWTAEVFLRRIQEWLSLTARGELHRPDQPLEPVFFGSLNRVVLPASAFELTGDLPARLVFARSETVGGVVTYIAESAADHAAAVAVGGHTFVGVSYTASASVQPHMRQAPRTLADLDRVLPSSGEGLVESVRTKLLEWAREGDAALDATPIFVVRQPLQRTGGGPVVAVDAWAFVVLETLRVVGGKLGVWSTDPETGEIGVLIGLPPGSAGDDIELTVLDPVSTLTAESTAEFNGRVAEPGPTVVAVGAGALGSHLLDALARSGYGTWTVVDKDVLLPHNAARHVLRSDSVGRPKAVALAAALNATHDGAPFVAVVTDVLGELPDDLGRRLDQTDVVLDVSASVPVARRLALDVESSARRVSAFLNPSGTDLVVLAEDAGRSHRLDHLEAAYLRALVYDARLRGHHAPLPDGVRYAHGCHDVSARIPHESVAVHGATAAGAVRAALGLPGPSASVWRRAPDGSVARVAVTVGGFAEGAVGEWTVAVSRELLHEIERQRGRRLPRETGGVLLGMTDLVRRRLYVLGQVPSPPDSQEWPTAYVRGIEGLADTLGRVAGATGGQVTYLGEWHSHPAGVAARPSVDDAHLFDWLADHMAQDGLPAVMLIAADGGRSALFVGSLGAGALDL